MRNEKTKLYEVEVYHKPTKRVVQTREVPATSGAAAVRKVRAVFAAGSLGCLDYRFKTRVKEG